MTHLNYTVGRLTSTIGQSHPFYFKFLFTPWPILNLHKYLWVSEPYDNFELPKILNKPYPNIALNEGKQYWCKACKVSFNNRKAFANGIFLCQFEKKLFNIFLSNYLLILEEISKSVWILKKRKKNNEI